MKCFLSIDCGLTKSKLAIFNHKGELLLENEMSTPLKGTLINTAAFANAVTTMIYEAFINGPVVAKDIMAVCVSGHGNGLYILGDYGILPYAYSSMFTESQDYIPDIESSFPINIQSSWSGQPLAILSYLYNREPVVFAKIRKVLFCKDLVKYILTGRVCTDYTDASAAGMLNYETGEYDKELLKLYGLEEYTDLLPDLCRSTDIIGTVSESIAQKTGLLKNTPVIGGLFDVNSCMVGAGVINPDRYCIISGTWGVNSAVVPQPLKIREITQCCNFCYPDRFMCIDSAPTSCVNLEWFLKNVLHDISFEEADYIVEKQPMNDKLFYFPYIYKPMDMNISGGFMGLSHDHDYKDMLRAVFEGIVFEHAYRIEKFKENGIVHDSAVLVGGASNSSVFCHMFADCLGIKIYTTVRSQSGALGLAVMGAVASGVYPDLETAAKNMVAIKECYLPNPNSSLKYKFKKFKKYLEAQQSML